MNSTVIQLEDSGFLTALSSQRQWWFSETRFRECSTSVWLRVVLSSICRTSREKSRISWSRMKSTTCHSLSPTPSARCQRYDTQTRSKGIKWQTITDKKCNIKWIIIYVNKYCLIKIIWTYVKESIYISFHLIGLQGIVSDQERKKMKRKGDRYSTQTSLIVATLKRLLPVGLNICAPGEQELIALAKNRFTQVAGWHRQTHRCT